LLLGLFKEDVMQMSELKQRIDRIEECADDAEQAMRTGSVPADLRQRVDAMHQQARQLQQACSSTGQQQGDQSRLRDMVAELEQSGDRAMDACRQARNVDPSLQQAVQRAHQEASSLKKEVQMS
jgi:uncharacterized protein Yka (UPF0111/DUF47 family)